MMKKLLGLLIFTLILSGCSNKAAVSPDGLKYNYLSMAYVKKKGLDYYVRGYGFSREQAMENAMIECKKVQSQKKKLKNGICTRAYTCNAKGYKCASGTSAYVPKKITQSSSSGSKIDPSVWDDIISGSQGILSGKSISESLGGSTSSSTSTSLSCFKKSESTSGTNKICIYNCMGSDVAVNVKSTQLCPISIKN